MAKVIRLDPDEIAVRGSRQNTIPPVPRHHMWQVNSRSPESRLDDQIRHLTDRLRPCQEGIRNLLDDLEAGEADSFGAGGALQIVRYLDDPGGEADGWQHRLLGWGLERHVLRFLADVGARVDVDEYGQDWPWYQRLPDLLDSTRSAINRLARRREPI